MVAELVKALTQVRLNKAAKLLGVAENLAGSIPAHATTQAISKDSIITYVQTFGDKV